MELYLIIALVFLSVFSASLIALTLFTGKGQIKARLRAIEDRDKRLKTEKVARGATLRKGVSLLVPDSGEDSRTREMLNRAGFRNQESIYTYYGFKLLIAVLLPAAVLLLSRYVYLDSEVLILVVLFAVLLGWLVPKFWVMWLIKRRSEEIRRAVPHALDLIVVCVEGGLSFTAAIQKVADDISLSSQALSDELRLVTHEVLVGRTKTDAFRGLANRTGVADLRSLAVTLIQAEKLGTSIARSLRVLADSMRFKRRQRAEEMANKAAVKLVFPLVLLIFPQLLVIIAGPAVITLIKNLTQMGQ